jgi:gamma-glutamyltranspeptidase/glutathione hydrolase
MRTARGGYLPLLSLLLMVLVSCPEGNRATQGGEVAQEASSGNTVNDEGTSEAPTSDYGQNAPAGDPTQEVPEEEETESRLSPLSYTTFDADSVGVEVPEVLGGYREPFEEADKSLSRQRGWDTPAGGTRMAVAARDPVAARVAFRVLQAGGNAADAAFALGAAISVREPWFSHALGGGTWALYRDGATGAVTAVDGAGTIGSDANAQFFRDPDNLREHGMEWAIVPGAWDAWLVWLEEFGTMELDELLAPAVDLAENGVSASRTMVGWITQQRESIASRPATAAIFLQDGEVPSAGDTIYQKDLARTLKMIVAAYRRARSEGRSAALEAAREVYYQGPIGEAIVAHARINRGSLTLEDFRSYRAELREPLENDFYDWKLYNPPPNSQGIVMPLALNIVEAYDLRGNRWNDPETIHVVAEAMNLAHIDKHRYVGDPDHVEIPLETLLSNEYARAQAGRIEPGSAVTWPAPGGVEANEGFTTTFSVLDAEGNGAAITTSIGAQFVVAGETGILMNQRLQNVFYDDPDNPNFLVPGRRVRHTVNPYIAELPGETLVLGGNTGYDTQPQGQIQQFLNIALFDANAQEAVSRPRYIAHSFPDITYPHEVRNELALEQGFSNRVVSAIRERGHRVSRGAIFGNANVIIRNLTTGEIEAGADPRGENLAIAE